MKNKIKILAIMEIMILMIISLITTVTASSETFNVTITANKTELKPGEEITITVGVSDINMGENGINTLEGKIEYDKELFEEIKSSSIQSLNNWSTTYNDESSNLNGKFLSVSLSAGIKENTQIFKVTLKAKQEIKNTTDTQISFKNITSNDGTNLVSIGTKTTKLKVSATSTNEPTTEEPTEEPNKDLGKNEIIGTTDKTADKSTDKTQSTKQIPKTGKSLAIISAVLVTVIAIVILGIKNRSMRDIK